MHAVCGIQDVTGSLGIVGGKAFGLTPGADDNAEDNRLAVVVEEGRGQRRIDVASFGAAYQGALDRRLLADTASSFDARFYLLGLVLALVGVGVASHVAIILCRVLTREQNTLQAALP